MLLVLVSGCGIEQTGVIDVGQPASGAKRPGASAREAVLYFISPTGMRPVRRPSSGDVSAEDAVHLLIDGPNDAERHRGMETAVPKMAGVHVTTGKGRVSVQLPVNVKNLGLVVRNQLVCTAADNNVPGDQPSWEVKVDLSGGGNVLEDLLCGAHSGLSDSGVLTPSTPSAPGAGGVNDGLPEQGPVDKPLIPTDDPSLIRPPTDP
ncbi:hypothetical protein ACFU99_15845 [Streptomyces sp. NPDC057654]|uniref:hypothetical protein n=1 Tax=Streptomyces sp. NPDC057654 TaxID=3346196 RepID=UPI0036965A1E